MSRKIVFEPIQFDDDKQKKAIQRMPRNVETLITVKKIDFDFYEEYEYY